MDAKQLYVYLRKVRMWLALALDWAVERDELAVNVASDIKTDRAFGKQPVQHFASLALDEVRDFLQRMALEKDIQSVLACRLLAYTWVRTNELRGMRWDEIRDNQWEISGARMKMSRDHIVPLSRQAMTIIAQMRARSSGSVYVFPSFRRIDRPMSENAVLYLIHRIGYQGRMTGHGWRSVASTWANERGYRPNVIERQLAHVPDDAVRAAYNRAEYRNERAQMMQAWSDWLDEQATHRTR